MSHKEENKTENLFSLVREGSITVASANLLLKIVGFVSTVLVLRELSVYDYGIWRLLLGVVTFSLIITLPSLDGFINADLGRELGKKNIPLYKSMLVKISTTLLSFGAIATVGLFLAAPLITKISGIDITVYLRILSVSLILSVISRIYKFVFSTHLKFGLNNGLNVLNKIIYLALLALLFFVFQLGLMSVVVAYVGALAGSVILFLPFFVNTISYLKKELYSKYSVWDTVIKEHGKWGMASSYFDDFVSSIRPWIIGYFTSIEVLGLFSAALSLFSEVSNLSPVNNVLNSIIPRISHEKDKLFFLVNRSLKYTAWIFLVLALGSFFLMPLIIKILVPNYSSAVPAFSILLVSLFAIPANGVANSLLNTFKFQKELFVSSILPQTLSLLFILPLSLIGFGLYGAVLDRVLANYFITISRFRCATKLMPELKFKFSDLVSFDSYDRDTFMRLLTNNVNHNEQ